MLRLLFLVAFIFLAFGGIWRLLAPARRAAGRPRPIPRMVQCARCDLYVPEEEALQTGEHYYCSEAHRLSGPRGSDR